MASERVQVRHENWGYKSQLSTVYDEWIKFWGAALNEWASKLLSVCQWRNVGYNCLYLIDPLARVISIATPRWSSKKSAVLQVESPRCYSSAFWERSSPKRVRVPEEKAKAQRREGGKGEERVHACVCHEMASVLEGEKMRLSSFESMSEGGRGG